MSKLFLCDYIHYEQYVEISLKCQFWRDGYWAFNRLKWWVLITVRNIYRVYQTKYYYSSVEKNNSSFSWNLQIDKKKKKINTIIKKKIQGKKLIQNLFSQAA